MENNKTTLVEKDILFTIGAFIKPMKVVINGIEQWRWIVTSLEDQTFLNGNEIEVYDYADKLEDLVV
jgi:hypothetical protein